MSRTFVVSLVLVLFSAVESMPAQVQNRKFISDGNPAIGGANTFPWSREQLRYQLIFTAKQMGNVPCVINDILLAPQTRMNPPIKTAVYDDIEIRMGMTTQATPTGNWATNNPKPTTVYRGPLRATFEVGKWRGLGLPKSFLYLPIGTNNNLCVEFIIWKINPQFRARTVSIRAVTAPSTVRRAFYFRWTIAQSTQPSIGSSACKLGLVCNDGNFVATDDGCLSSKGTKLSIGSDTFPQIGKPLTITLSGALPTSIATLAIGFSDTKGFGGSLPLSTSFLGAPSCFLWNEPILQVVTVTDAQGNGRLKFTVPNVGGNPRVYAHWWNLDKAANAAGVTSSNYGKVLIGR